MTDHGRSAAGVLVAALSTNRVLLLRRSDAVTEPGTWGIPGGRVDHGEQPRLTALRELSEETNYDGSLDMSHSPLFVFEDDGFRYETYLAFVVHEFEPHLNWEHSSARWFSISKLPEPLHFGVAEMFAEGSDEISALIQKRSDDPATRVVTSISSILSRYMDPLVAIDVARNAASAIVVGEPAAESVISTVRHRLRTPRATIGGRFPALTEDDIAEIHHALVGDTDLAEAVAKLEVDA